MTFSQPVFVRCAAQRWSEAFDSKSVPNEDNKTKGESQNLHPLHPGTPRQHVAHHRTVLDSNIGRFFLRIEVYADALNSRERSKPAEQMMSMSRRSSDLFSRFGISEDQLLRLVPFSIASSLPRRPLSPPHHPLPRP